MTSGDPGPSPEISLMVDSSMASPSTETLRALLNVNREQIIPGSDYQVEGTLDRAIVRDRQRLQTA